MHEKSILTLEYPKILEKVAREAAFSASKALVMELRPTSNLEEAQRRLNFTTEASRLIDLRNDAGIQGAHDIRPYLERASREGVLNPSELLEVHDTVKSAIFVAHLLEKLDEVEFPLMHLLGADIAQRPQVARRIEEAISEEGEVLDTASPTFAEYLRVRTNRHDDFYIRPAGGVDLCNVQVPVRKKS